MWKCFCKKTPEKMHISALKAVAAPFQIITKKVSSYRQKTQKEIPKKPKRSLLCKNFFFCKNTDDGVIVGLFSEKCLQKHKTIIKKEKEIHFHKKHALSQMIHCPLTLSEHYWRDFKTRALNSARPRTVYVV